jgi:hypothetical protein
MNVELGIVGLICVAMAIGHETIGVVWVLPSLTEEQLPRTPFGPPSLSLGMVRVTWHIVAIFVLTVGGILLTLAWDATADPKAVLLGWFAGMWLAATAMAGWVVRRDVRKPRSLVRLPVPLFWVIVGVLCWKAAT